MATGQNIESFYLGPDDIHIWKFHLDELAPEIYLLSREELDFAYKLRQSVDRRRYLSSHSAMRNILSKYAKTGPENLAFHLSPEGKPSLSPRHIRFMISFNLSHSQSIGLLAVSAYKQVGIDIEVDCNANDLEVLAVHFMTTMEFYDFTRMKKAPQRAAFYSLWTQKESLLKAMGCGLLRDPKDFELGLTTNNSKSITDNGIDWTILPLVVDTHTYSAVTIEGKSSNISNYVYLGNRF